MRDKLAFLFYIMAKRNDQCVGSGFNWPLDPDTGRQNYPQKNKIVQKFHVLKCWMFFRVDGGFSCSLKALHGNLRIKISHLLIQIFEFFSQLLQFFLIFGHENPRIRQKAWIRIRIQWSLIHNNGRRTRGRGEGGGGMAGRIERCWNDIIIKALVQVSPKRIWRVSSPQRPWTRYHKTARANWAS